MAENNGKKKLSKGKIALIIVGAVLLLIILAIGIVGGTLLVKYNTLAYERHAAVERTDEYVMPDYPEVIIASSDEWQEGVDLVPETDSPETTAETGLETETEEETEHDPSETIYAPADKTLENEPEETLAPVVNSSTSTPQQSYTPPSNPDASFANSENAVSVYGKTPIYKVAQKDKNVRNILVMGTDSRDVTSDRGRSDTMIIVSYNSEKGTVKMTSLLRDSLVPIEGVGWNRINTAYFYGGVGLAINTVNQLYNLDIQEFIIIDLNGAKNFVDYVGGVDIELSAEEAELYSLYTGRQILPGLNHLDASLAMTHMRNRTIGNDFGRTQRQRDTLTAIAKKLISEKSVADLYDITDYTFSLIKTNITATSLLSLATSVLMQGSNLSIDTANVPFSDAYQFAWYNNMSIISFDIAYSADRLNKFIYEQ